jgi:hypothetical protein
LARLHGRANESRRFALDAAGDADQIWREQSSDREVGGGERSTPLALATGLRAATGFEAAIGDGIHAAIVTARATSTDLFAGATSCDSPRAGSAQHRDRAPLEDAPRDGAGHDESQHADADASEHCSTFAPNANTSAIINVASRLICPKRLTPRPTRRNPSSRAAPGFTSIS